MQDRGLTPDSGHAPTAAPPRGYEARMEHGQNIEAQITDAWRKYVGCCLEHNADEAEQIMRRINALLECVPRAREVDCS